MKFKIIVVFVLSILVISCKNKPAQKADGDLGLIRISKVQFEAEKMKIGKPSQQPFADKVYCTGVITPSVNGKVKISLPIPGIIDKIYYSPAQRVSKGALLFEISGQWLINIQKDLAESSAVLSKLESDYKMAKGLYEENIGTIKEYTAAKSKYYAEKANYNALKKQLSLMGLDAAKIETGTFYSSFPVKSPISGYVSSIHVAVGQYVEPQQSIAEIIDNDSFQLKLSVFAKDLHKIKPGQKVEFYFNAYKAEKYYATLNTIGKTIMSDSKSIECYAKIEDRTNRNIVSNQFVEGDIYTSADTTWAVPEAAILESEHDFYILLLEKEDDSIYYVKKMKVDIGRKSNSYVELKGEMPSKKILLSGVYNIMLE